MAVAASLVADAPETMTVPFAFWTAMRYLNDFEPGIRACVAVGGDMDTTAAIAGGIIAARTGTAGIPPGWLELREALPDWLPSMR